MNEASVAEATVTILNEENDTKRISYRFGKGKGAEVREINLGSRLDREAAAKSAGRGEGYVHPPEVRITGAEFESLLADTVAGPAFSAWRDSGAVRVIGA